MRGILALCALCLWLSPAMAVPPQDFAQCDTLETCLRTLDSVAAQHEYGVWLADDPVFAAKLEQFGAPAKRALLARATGSDKAWRDLSGAILMYWKDLDARDVPALIAALRLDPGGWVAGPLGHLGTPEALQALANDVRLHGEMNQSGAALHATGGKATPYLLSILEQNQTEGVRFVSEMGDTVSPALDDWAAIALDAHQAEPRRVAALAGLGAAAPLAKRYAPKLRALLEDGGPGHDMAEKVLLAMADESMFQEAFGRCHVHENPFSFYNSEIAELDCLSQMPPYGDQFLAGADIVLSTFGESRNGQDRADAASAIGYIGYRQGTARLIGMLSDSDWRVVFAASRSLGWMGAKDAVPELQRIAVSYWFEPVRKEASVSLTAIQSGQGSLPRPPLREGRLNFPPAVKGLTVDASDAPDGPPCTSGRWRWQGREFGEPDSPRMILPVPASGNLPGGVLTGSDHGEWGGVLKWHPQSGPDQILQGVNVEGIEPTDDGAIAVFGEVGAFKPYSANPAPDGEETLIVSNGPSGYGYALHFSRDESGSWRMAEVARLPRAVDAFTSIGPGLYAAWSGDRAVVLSTSRILGVAECVAQQ